MAQNDLNPDFHKVAEGVVSRLSDWSGESLRTRALTSEGRDAAIRKMDTGRIAALKRGLGSVRQPDFSIAWILSPLIPSRWDTESREYKIIYQIALLYTLHPYSRSHDVSRQFWSPLTISVSNANADENGNRQSTWRKEFSPQDKRINRLLSTRREDELFGLLVKLLKPLMNDSEVPIDWVQLGKDMRSWENQDGLVQLRWAHGWYGGISRSEVDAQVRDGSATDS